MPFFLSRNKGFTSPAAVSADGIQHSAVNLYRRLLPWCCMVASVADHRQGSWPHPWLIHIQWLLNTGKKYPAFLSHVWMSLVSFSVFSTPSKDGWAIPLEVFCSLTSSCDSRSFSPHPRLLTPGEFINKFPALYFLPQTLLLNETNLWQVSSVIFSPLIGAYLING